MKLKLILIHTLTLLAFTACSTSTLTYDKSTFNLRVDNKQLQIHGTEQKSNRENFSILFLEQKLIKLDDGSLVMYESGETDMSYEFANITTRTIDIVFDARKIITVYDKAFIYAYQIVLADGRVLNAVVSQSYDQEIAMVYGMSSDKLDKMLRKLEPTIQPVPYKNAIVLNNQPNPLMSNWTTWKVNFVPLVQPLPRRLTM